MKLGRRTDTSSPNGARTAEEGLPVIGTSANVSFDVLVCKHVGATCSLSSANEFRFDAGFTGGRSAGGRFCCRGAGRQRDDPEVQADRRPAAPEDGNHPDGEPETREAGSRPPFSSHRRPRHAARHRRRSGPILARSPAHHLTTAPAERDRKRHSSIMAGMWGRSGRR